MTRTFALAARRGSEGDLGLGRLRKSTRVNFWKKISKILPVRGIQQDFQPDIIDHQTSSNRCPGKSLYLTMSNVAQFSSLVDQVPP